MPPLENRPGAFYACEADADYEPLIDRALDGEFTVIRTLDEAGLVTFLFAAAADNDPRTIVQNAAMERVINAASIVRQRVVIANGRKLQNG